MKYIASVSFGKDSLAMLLLLIEKEYRLDGVVFYDTGMEFNSIYRNRDKIVELLHEKQIPYYELHPENTFEYMAFYKPIKSRKDGTIHYGHSWCGKKCRWGTKEKLKTMKKFEENFGEDIIYYIGIAYDEKERYERLDKSKKISILYELEMTEKDCLEYCYSKGYNWIENGVDLYSILDRVSCWCCRNKNKKELRNIYLYLPEYWEKLKEFQSKTEIPMKDYVKRGVEYGNVFELEEYFKKERFRWG